MTAPRARTAKPLRAPRLASAADRARPTADRMPVEELSRRSGVTVRNLRQLQTHGLVEPPLLEGRKGIYTERHLARVTLVRTLQDRGYSIAAIADLLEQWKTSLGPFGVMQIEDSTAIPDLSHARRLSQPALLALIPELRTDEALLEEMLASELVCRDDEGALFAPHAEQLEIARAIADVGIPLDVQVADFHVLRDELELMVQRFRQRFQDHVVSKLQRKGMPADAIEKLSTQVAHLRPAVVRGVAIALSIALQRGGRLPAVASARKSKRRTKR